MFLQTVLMALREIRRNTLRSVLTMLGVVIGVGAVIALVSVGRGATQKVTDGSGNPIITITYGYDFDSYGRLTKETDTGSDGEVATKTYVYQ